MIPYPWRGPEQIREIAMALRSTQKPREDPTITIITSPNSGLQCFYGLLCSPTAKEQKVDTFRTDQRRKAKNVYSSPVGLASPDYRLVMRPFATLERSKKPKNS